MLSKHLNEELNNQIMYEFFSAHLYLAMAAKFESLDFAGASNYMKVQAEEEKSHAMKIFDFIAEKGGDIEILGFETPVVKGNDILEIFEETLEHEQWVTKRINLLMDIAQEERDYSVISFLNWFIDEQVEEESNADAIIKKLRLIGDNSNGLYQMDKELATRVFVDDTQE
ncbi:ferritin [endosymbiont 'TC1' of Trimyema compressum]|uniref:ferritin n=1 Tax=endosymbiont 'TC1' of Trimyema compressum TaxID=243899 RepID=UPI0007F15868|nr:ferritin [endosymbiont 'TC1' of Trimyema compressum]AMP20082.1 ferritin [endosymbiont 'TC1' of Trimyema compressum]